MPNHNNNVSQEAIISINYLVQRGRDSTVFGYKDISAELHLLIFSFDFGIDASTDDTTIYKKVFIVEPVQDLLRCTADFTFPSHTASETCLTLAQDWIARCLRQHTKCNVSPKRPEPYYPTRLVEILVPGKGTDLRLCLTREEVPTGPYMTLSHRWGAASFLKLSLSKLPDLVKGFSIAELPQTFQDAIIVARRLGCKYLWIDSLCIIQDSTDDWLHEAGLMGEVYANSYCNIAATWNSSSDDGLFTKRNGSEVEGIVVHPKWAGLKSASFRVVEFGLWERLVTSAGLNKRAWVVQERLLAPRVLHFGQTQLAWECHEVDACETYPTSLPVAQQSTETIHKGLDPETDGKTLQSMGDSESSPNLHPYHVWNKIVAAYTAGELTVASDKLVALSGLAKKMQTLLQDEYLAGLWKRTLASDLLWKVNGGRQANGRLSTRAAQYRAPTWSWAALDGHITPGRPDINRILISIEEAATDPVVPGHPLGQLLSGWIRLRGVLLPGTVRLEESSPSQLDKLKVCFSAAKDSTDHWIFPDIQGEILDDEAVVCLMVSTANRYSGTLVQGLALICTDAVKATYRRVGLFEGFQPSSGRDLPIQYSRSTRRIELSKDAEMKTIILI
ncbi:hypothetical protein XANCAGTX0491_008577 [Xanthoria calcicola]